MSPPRIGPSGPSTGMSAKPIAVPTALPIMPLVSLPPSRLLANMPAPNPPAARPSVDPSAAMLKLPPLPRMPEVAAAPAEV
jgi:hypothetical protein